jgi:arylsulfatase A-like enzyme
MPVDRPPNLLIFMTDQQRGSTTRSGSPALTPEIDRFRRESVTFSSAWAVSPHCCPSRASFFTGLYPSRHGVWNNVCVQTALSTGLNPGVRCWSETLAERGYQLDWNGKWHVSWDEGPDTRGFQVHTITAAARHQGQGVMGLTWEKYATGAGHSADTPRQPGEIKRPGYGDYFLYGPGPDRTSDDLQVDSAVEVIRNRTGTRPWCHYIGTLGPHDPYTPPERFLELYRDIEISLPENFDDAMNDKPGLYRRMRRRFSQLGPEEHREAIRHYLASCSHQDYLFGRVLRALEESGQMDSTVVIYCSDHGDYLAEHGLWCKGLPCFRGAYDVPLIIRAPGHDFPHGTVVNQMVSLIDIAPTIRELAGLSPDPELPGHSLVPFLHGRTPEKWRDACFTQFNGAELYGIQRSIFTGEWKLIFNGFDFDELYNLRDDPGETVNRAQDPETAGIRENLYRRLWAFACEQGDQAINSYITTGLAEFGPGVAFPRPSLFPAP